MVRRYLFGPVKTLFADQALHGPRQRGDCLAFGDHDGVDLTIGVHDTWDQVCSRLPADWQPDFIVLYLPYTMIPQCLWSAPVPVIGLAADWNLLWHYYRRCLALCDIVLTDTVGVETMQRAGLSNGRVANLYGCERAFLEATSEELARDIDLLFIGNVHVAVQRERLPWIARLAGLADKWNVVVRAGVYGAEYRSLLARSRIVFNRSIRAECNKRTFEAAAAGALLFQEAGNREVSSYFQDRQEFISYTHDDLEKLLHYYLEHEEERRAIADAGRRRAQSYGFEALWEATLDSVSDELAQLPCKPRQLPSVVEMLRMRTWQLSHCVSRADSTLTADIQASLELEPSCAVLRHCQAVTQIQGHRTISSNHLGEIISTLRQTLLCDPEHHVAKLNLAEMLLAAGQAKESAEEAKQALGVLERTSEIPWSTFDAPHLPLFFDHFRVEWERAAWLNVGQPQAEADAKRLLMQWRLHSLLGGINGDSGNYYEAVFARPDIPSTRAALGCALARAGQFPQAVRHLTQAVVGNPFDTAAAKAYFVALGEVGDKRRQSKLVEQRRLLVKAALGVLPAEAWFMEDRAPTNDLASIVILCCNQVEYTRQCMESIIQHTSVPYELLVVDNGSTDETSAYLNELKHRAGPQNVTVIRNESNLGFAAGCNQGLKAAQGQYFVLLNNDTIVTSGWLEDMIAWSRSDWPHVGLVGPMTSWASPPQQVPINYSSPDELQAFAAQRRKEFAGKAMQVQRLIGFCLLFRRDVWEKLGGLDERFGLGFFEDDDLCVRAREAGFRLIMALNVFVHHYGNRTFQGLGLDARAQLQTNFEVFRAKWGDDHCRGYRLPDTAAQNTPTEENRYQVPAEVDPKGHSRNVSPPVANLSANLARMTVSLCMIVKNEENHLEACLTSVADLVDEMVVVDTGSTDCTKEIAASCGAKVFDFPWVDSFAAARNDSLRHAHGDWIFWLDADEQLDDANRLRLNRLFNSLKDQNLAYVMRQYSRLEATTHGAAQVDQVRLFRNRPDIRWEYRVHEQILLAVRRSGGDVRLTDIVIDHAGFSEPKVQGPKVDRNLRLLELELADRPDDAFVLYNLGAVRLTQGSGAEALALFERSLANSQPGDVLVRKLHALITRAHHQLNRQSDALHSCRDGLKAFPEDGELLFWQAMLLREMQDLDGAAASLKRVLQARPPQHFTSVDAGLYGYRAHHFLAEIYRDQNALDEAEAQWLAALDQCPSFSPARLELAKLFVETSRWEAFAAALPHLENDPQTAWEASVLRGRAHLGQRNFREAKSDFRQAAASAPKALVPRVFLSHALLQEGHDWPAAEKALLDVLALDPQNREAQHNLSILRQHHASELKIPQPAAAANSNIKVSLCMIVRNEEDNLPGCLESVADLVEEIIIVDTGSTDRTKELAAVHNAKVFDFPWIDDFAAARNESLRHATGKWIFWLDADDRLDESHRSKLRALFASLQDETAGYVMKCLCVADAQGVETAVDHLRLFCNHPDARWSFRVHEQILPALRRIQADIRWSDVVIHHIGYRNAAIRQRKLQRDLRLLEVEQAEQPDHAFTLFNLGSVYQELGRTQEALDLFRRSLERSAPADSIVRKLYALITQCHRALGQKPEALAACQQGLEICPEDIELIFQQGLTQREMGELAAAAKSWEQCLASAPGPHFASINTGLKGHITRHNLATVYRELGLDNDAEIQWKGALEDRPYYEPAWQGLAQLFLKAQRWQELAALADELEGSGDVVPAAACVRGRLHLAREEYGAACTSLNTAAARFPQALEPRVLLSHALLQEGKDWPAAEKALRDILALDPTHAEAKHNLAVLLRQQALA